MSRISSSFSESGTDLAPLFLLGEEPVLDEIPLRVVGDIFCLVLNLPVKWGCRFNSNCSFCGARNNRPFSDRLVKCDLCPREPTCTTDPINCTLLCRQNNPLLRVVGSTVTLTPLLLDFTGSEYHILLVGPFVYLALCYYPAGFVRQKEYYKKKSS